MAIYYSVWSNKVFACPEAIGVDHCKDMQIRCPFRTLIIFFSSMSRSLSSATKNLKRSSGVEPGWPSILLNLGSLRMTGYSSLHNDIDVSLPLSCKSAKRAWKPSRAFRWLLFSTYKKKWEKWNHQYSCLNKPDCTLQYFCNSWTNWVT